MILKITVEIQPRPGVIVPSPHQIAKLLYHKLVSEVMGLQRYTDTRSLTQLNKQVHEMVNMSMEIEK